MPCREYKCPKCLKIFERYEKISVMEDPMDCTICCVPTKRMISKSTFILLPGGVGWAKNGYSRSK